MKRHVVSIFSLVLAAALLIGAEIYASRKEALFASEFIQTRESIVLKKKKILADLTAPVDILFLGDSTMDAGIDDQLFTSLIGQKALNLELNGNLITYGDYRMLENYLQSFPPPKAIVVWHTIDVWQRDLSLTDFFFMLPTWTEQMDVIMNSMRNIQWSKPNVVYWPVQYVSQIVHGQLYSLLKSFRYKVWIKKRLSTIVPGIDTVGTIQNLSMNTSESSQNQLQLQIKGLKEMSGYVSKDSEYWFNRLVDLAKRNNIRVFAARSPIHEAIVADPQAKKFLDQLNSALTHYFDSLPVTQLECSNPIFLNMQSRGDKDHVNRDGQIFLTRYYVAQLQKWGELAHAR